MAHPRPHNHRQPKVHHPHPPGTVSFVIISERVLQAKICFAEVQFSFRLCFCAYFQIGGFVPDIEMEIGAEFSAETGAKIGRKFGARFGAEFGARYLVLVELFLAVLFLYLPLDRQAVAVHPGT